MTKKYFFFDIDGTLTSLKDGKLVESARKTIEELQAQGHFVAIATGRAFYKSKGIAKEAGIHNIVSNGGAALTINDELVKNSPLDKEKALKLLGECEEKGVGALIAFDDSIDVFMKDEKFISQVGLRQEPTKYYYDPSKKFEDIKDIYKMYLAISPEQEKEFEDIDMLGHVRFVSSYLTYQHDAKDQGIKDMMKEVGAKDEDVIVFGDAENDMVMFHKEWTKVCVKSDSKGNDELAAIADVVTDYAENDGIRKACIKLGFIHE